MKKIGICACYDTLNYGSMLQAFATQVSIEKFGWESEFIVYKKKKTVRFVIKQIPRLFNKNLMFDKMLVIRKKLALRKHPTVLKQEQIRHNAFTTFKKKYYGKFSKVYYGYEALKEGAQNYYTVLVGSDQLWTPGGLATNFYNLMFVPEEVNKVSYATSFGVNSIPGYQVKRTRQYLMRINHLSVREVRGAEIIKQIANREAEVVVDPTLLLTKEEWEQCIPKQRIVDKPYIFCYFLGENLEHRKIATLLKKKTGLDIVCTPFLDSFVESDLNFGDKQLFNIGPHDFVNLIRHANYILTDSFHGTVFSIIHNKQFIVLNRFNEGTQSRNSRIDSLCQILGLEDRRYNRNADIYEQMNAHIDFASVEHKKEELRQKSLLFLQRSLNDGVKK